MEMEGRLTYSAAAQLFRAPFLRKVIAGTHREQLEEVAHELRLDLYKRTGGAKQIGEILREIYSLLTEKYRCEYVFKNLVARSLYIERHRQDNSYFASEVRARDSRLDVAIFNGTSTAYEIKSEYDSFEKLDSQLADYSAIFDRIYLVVPAVLQAKALRILPEQYGLIVVGEGLCLKTKRVAASNRSNTSASAIFDIMRASEYEASIVAAFGSRPMVSNADRYLSCKALFESLEPYRAHDLMVRQVRCRSQLAVSAHIDKFPELLFSLLTGNFSSKCVTKLDLALHS